MQLADLNADGYIDVLMGTPGAGVWNPERNHFDQFTLPVRGGSPNVRWFTATPEGKAGLAVAGDGFLKTWIFNGDGWVQANNAHSGDIIIAAAAELCAYRFRDLNGDGVSDLILNNEKQSAVYLGYAGKSSFRLNPGGFALPRPGMLIGKDGKDGKDAGLRFVDLDADGDDDLIFSNEKEYGVWRFDGVLAGWIKVRSGKAGAPDAIPSIVEHGRNNGVWFHSGKMIQANEFSAGKKDLIRRVSFKDLLKTRTDRIVWERYIL